MKQGYWTGVWHEFKKNKMALSGLYIVMFLFIIAIFAPLIANNKPYILIEKGKAYFPVFVDYPLFQERNFRHSARGEFKIMPPVQYSYSEYDLDSIVTGPSSKHWFGTDEQGRDLFARMVHGTRVSITVGFIAVAIYVLIGILIGSIAGYYGGIIDILISRLIEIIMCFPTFFLILTVLALIGPSLLSVMAVIGVTSWTGIARIVRGEFMRIREMDFVTASRALGASDYWIILRHILPNSMAPVFVSATFGIASTILIESSLSFLGFGVQPPTPSWGDILSQSRDFIDFAWWLTLIPGLAIFITITSYNLVGEGLQSAIDPKSR
jgi:peptide/nickel transport system permease protein